MTLKDQLSELPEQIEISLKLENEIDDLFDLEQFTYAISAIHQDIDFFDRDYPWRYESFGPWHRRSEEFEKLKKRFQPPKLIRFRINSPPVFTVLADPAWLAVIIAILTQYKQGKESIQELGEDVHTFVHRIVGLTKLEKQILEMAVDLYIQQNRQNFQDIFDWLREKILGKQKTSKSVNIRVKKKKGKKRD